MPDAAAGGRGVSTVEPPEAPQDGRRRGVSTVRQPPERFDAARDALEAARRQIAEAAEQVDVDAARARLAVARELADRAASHLEAAQPDRARELARDAGEAAREAVEIQRRESRGGVAARSTVRLPVVGEVSRPVALTVGAAAVWWWLG